MHEGVEFQLVKFRSSYRSTVYTVEFKGSQETELEKWVGSDRISTHEEFDGVYNALEAIPDEGVREDYFFKEEGYSGWVSPFVEEGYHELRLYCIKYQRQNWVIAGNGCVKDDDGPLQDFDRCRRTFNDIIYVEERLDTRLKGNDHFDLTAHEDRLSGNFYFPPKV